MNRRKGLSARGEVVMNLLWDSEGPLTSIDLMQTLEAEGWNNVTLFRILRELLKDSYMEVCGMAQHTTQYARQFKPVLSREEYWAGYLSAKGIDTAGILKLVMIIIQNDISMDSEKRRMILQKVEALFRSVRSEMTG